MLSIMLSALGGSLGAFMMHKIKERNYINNNRFSYKFADLLENQIINTEKIQKQFEKTDLDQEFSEMAKTFYSDYLLDDIKNLKVKEISIFEDLFFGFKESLQNIVSDEISDLPKSNFLDIPANLIFDDEQIKTISNNLSKSLAVFYENTDSIDLASKKVFESVGQVKIEELISNNLFTCIKKNLFKYSDVLPLKLKEKYDSTLDELIVNSLDKIDIENFIEEINEKIDNQRIYVALGINKSEFIKNIKNDIREYFATDYGRGIFIDACEEIYDYLDYSKKSLHDIIDNDYEIEIKKQVVKYENGIIDELLKWQDDLNDEIVYGVKSVVNKHVDDSKLAVKISESIINEYEKQRSSDKYTKLLKESYNEIEETDKVDNYIINEISAKFSKMLIKDFVNDLGNNFSANSIYDKLMLDLTSEDGKVVDKILNDFLNSKVKTVMKLNLGKLYRERFRYAFVDYIKDKIFYSKDLYLSICTKFFDGLETQKQKTVAEIFDQESISHISNSIRVDIAHSYFNDEDKTNEIDKKLKKFLENKSLAEVLGIFFESDKAVKKLLSDDFNSILNLMFNKKFDVIGEKRVKELVESLGEFSNINKSTSSIFRKIMSRALRSISKGFTYSKVYNFFEKKPMKEFTNFFGKISGYSDVKFLGVSVAITGLLTSMLTFGLSKLIDLGNNNLYFIFVLFLTFILGMVIDKYIINGHFFKRSKRYFKGLRGIFNYKKRVNDLIIQGVDALNSEEKSIEDRDIQQIVKVKYDIKQSITEENCKAFSDMIIDNMKFSTDKFVKLFLNFADEEKENIVKKYYADISLLSMRDLFNRRNISRITDEIDRVPDKSLIYFLKPIIASLGKNEFYKLSPDKLNQFILEEFDNHIYSNYNKLFDDFVNPVQLGMYFDKKLKFNFEDEKSLKDIFSIDKLDTLEGKIFSNLYNNFFNDKNITEFSEKSSKNISKKYFSDKKIENFLSRRAKIMITSMFYKLFADTVHTAKNELANNYKESVIEISKDVFLKLNNRETKKFDKLGAEKILEVILEDLYKVEIEKIFKDNLEKLYEPAKEYTLNILNLKTKDIKLLISEELYRKNLNEIIKKENGQALVYTKFTLVFTRYFDYILDSKYKELKKYMFDFKISNFMSYHRRDFRNAMKKVSTYYFSNKNEIMENTSELRNRMYRSILNDIKLNEMFESSDSIKKEFYDGLSVINEKCDFINLAIITIYNSMYQYLEDLDIVKSLIDSNLMINNLKLAFDKMFDAEKLYDMIIAGVNKKFSEGIPEIISDKFDSETKDYVIEMLIDEIYLCINEYMDSIYHNLNISEIVKNDLEKISSDEFDKLFQYKDLKFDI